MRALLLAPVLALAAAAAETPEQASSGADKALTLAYGNMFPDDWRAKDGSYGASGGVLLERGLGAKGTSLVAGGVFFDSYRERPSPDGRWLQDRVRSFPLTVGVQQRLGRGPVRPVLGAGVNPLVGVTRFAGPTREPQPYANGAPEFNRRTFAGYLSGGVRVGKGAVSAGVELRRWLLAGEPEFHAGAQLSATLTLSKR